MATGSPAAPTSDAAILSRLFRAEEDRLRAAAAELLLRVQFEPRDLDRMHDLVAQHQDDALSPDERVELESYRRVGYLLDLMHSRAPRALRNPPPPPRRASMEAHLTRLVRDRAAGRCAYCHLPQTALSIPFDIDRIVARKHGGPTLAAESRAVCGH